ncbi:Uma2 family endonuclease [Acidobacteria bacterium AH-259-G07]|nr:Uma2 family endonuclease [Acidobacteria bacterium AH-259-G07]
MYRALPVPGPYVIRLGGWTLERYLEEAPEDRIWEFVREEVVSPSTRTIDLKEKPQDYAQAGIREYWAVDAERKEITVHRLEARPYEVERLSGGTAECRAVPGLWLQADWLFQDRLPAAAECLQAVLAS